MMRSNGLRAAIAALWGLWLVVGTPAATDAAEAGVVNKAAEAAASDAPPPPGAELYSQYCAACHDHPKDRIPPRAELAKRSPDDVVQALTTGLMRTQASGMNMNERQALATYLTGKAPSVGLVTPPEKNLCAAGTSPLTVSGPQWNGWGRDLDNTRFQPDPGLTAAQVPHLELKWAFGYRGSMIYGQPTVVGGRVYVTSFTGRAYSLDAKTGCTHWTFDGEGPSRTAMSVAQLSAPAGKTAVFFGDDSANVYALDASNGKLLWKKRLDTHPAARISGAPVFYQGRLYVPVSSLEELSAIAPKYECCTFRGSVAALDATTGNIVWQTYTIDEKPKPYRKNSDGTQLYGPAGGAIWSAPTIDAKRKRIYVGTGNSYTDEHAPRTDAIEALDMETGKVLWSNQLTAGDNYVVGCPSPVEPCPTCTKPGQGSCPVAMGPDVDLGMSPILRTLKDGRQVLLTGQKSGAVHAVNPEDGKVIWAAQVGTGSSLGGIEWGSAADDQNLYVAISDFYATKGQPGLSALRLDTGKLIWHTPAPAPTCAWGLRSCSNAQSQAVSAIPGVVFSGSHDGHLRAYATTNGRILWTADTAQTFQTVNGVAAAGGSLDHGGATIVAGMLYLNSGYGRINGQPGNVLLAYAVRP